MKLPKLPFGVSYKALILALLLGGLVAVFAYDLVTLKELKVETSPNKYTTFKATRLEAMFGAWKSPVQTEMALSAFNEEINGAVERYAKNQSQSYLNN